MQQRTIGLIAEFDPFHLGHAHLLDAAKAALPGAAAVVAMSGWFTQRGEAAILPPNDRAEMAVRCGADVVLELPLTFATASAQRFARGGVAVLRAAGVTDLFCGSECADLSLLQAAATALTHPDYPEHLRTRLHAGVSFAAARAGAVEDLAGAEVAAVLSRPNDLLAVSYLEVIGDSPMRLQPIPRRGPTHNAPAPEGGFASASALRAFLRAGEPERAEQFMPPAAAMVLRRAWEQGRGPADLRHAERAVLYRLRQMGPADFAALPDCSEGLEHRLVQSAREAVTLEDFCQRVRSRRCPLARARRLALWAFLGLTVADMEPEPEYLRLLALGPGGRTVLRALGQGDTLPLLSTPAAGKRLPAGAIDRDIRAADLWQLCLPEAGKCGAGWRERPFVSVKSE